MPIKKFKTIFMASTIVLIMVVLSFTGLLNMSSFKQHYSQSLVSSLQMMGGETVRKIEFAIKYGKPLDNFYEIEEILSATMDKSPQIEQMDVLLPNGTVLYDQNGRLSTPYFMSNEVLDKVHFDASQESSHLSKLVDETYYVFLPIRDTDSEWIGTLSLRFDEGIVKTRVDEFINRQVLYLIVFAVGAALLLLFFFSKFSLLTEDNQIRHKRLIIFLCVILGSIQIIFGSINYMLLKNGYLETVKENTTNALKVIQSDIAYVVDKGVPYQKMYGVGDYMHRLIETNPEIDRVSIMNADFTTEIIGGQEKFASIYTYSVPLAEDSTDKANYIAVVDLSREHMASKTRSILLDTMTMVVISFLLLVEISLFLVFYLRKQLNKSSVEKESYIPEAGLSPGGVLVIDRTIIRPIGFIVFAAVYISSAFVPLLMKELYRPMFGLPQNVVLGLPISMEMFCLAISSIVAGYWIDRKGWKPSMMLGLGLLAIGTVLSGFAWDALTFILARGIVGLGFGFSLMAMQNFVILDETEEAKNQAISALNSGAYAGINCGVVVGAMLADRIGYAEVFYVGFVVALLGIFFVMKFMGEAPRPPQQVIASHEEAKVPKGALRQFLFDPQILSFLMLVIVPVGICGMFLYYFFPIFAESSGVSSSDVGRAFLLNGICIVFLGPLLSKYAEKYLGVRFSVIVSGLIVVIALGVFAIKGTIFSAIVAVVLLGIAEGFGITSQINYFLNQKAATELGEGKSLGYYSLVENFGQMIGPVVFGSMVVIGMNLGVGLIGLGLMAALILFFMLSGKRRQLTMDKEIGLGG